jgi:hypothetical protein
MPSPVTPASARDVRPLATRKSTGRSANKTRRTTFADIEGNAFDLIAG